VQMEVICAAAPLHPGMRICCFVGEQTGWALLPMQQFVAFCALALAHDDMFEPVWIRAAEMLAASLALAEPLHFAPGDVLLNLGTSWTLPNYFLHVRHARHTGGIRYVPFVHDVIPVVAPQYCLPGVVSDYVEWVGGVFDHADRLLTNSCSTASDLGRVADVLGHRLNDNDVHVIPLDAAIPQDGALPALAQERRAALGDFVLFVSSIEPRKNHLMAFRAWQMMIAQDPDATPNLVCVGHGGWLNEPVHAMLRDDPVLAAKVRILADVSDRELGQLYRSCRFTIYPSHYEGWGMPVTESLCHGKVPVVTRCSSLTEAGGAFAVYIEPDDVAGMARAVHDLWHHPDLLAAWEARIAADFHPRSWRDVALQIAQVTRFGDETVRQGLPLIELDTIYRMGRSGAKRVIPAAQIAEMLRQGLGWEAPEAGQCRARIEGGAVGFRLKSSQDRVFCHVRLTGGSLAVQTSTGVHQAPTSGWLSFEVQADEGRVDLTLGAKTALSHLVVSPCADLAQLARRMATKAASHYAFLRDSYPLITDQEAGPAQWQEFLPALEAGGLSRLDLLGILQADAKQP
jgi:glycosyltransferase involved in cell wall biosynthesis